ncbi:hypothetical protein [Caballeronia sp. LZ001]|uniref:hypothetical protein n=1 Tax=Caballeronia sp. LZ001 TaxID=3038553 RepID=UPI00286033BC|nr:hypothetical protein [Caballeronia sp. LZ001]MDR5805533.1 hypothetical protein [Caballeronia sp. LZ001]
MSMVLPSQAYTLQLKPQSFPVSVLRFSGKASVSELYEYQIDFTSPVADIPMDQVVGRPATFTIDPVDPDQGYLQRMFGERWKDFSKMPKSYVTHGMICRFEQLGMSADESDFALYLLVTEQLERASRYRLREKDDFLNYVSKGIVLSPRFDEHPVIQERLQRARNAEISHREALSGLTRDVIKQAAES